MRDVTFVDLPVDSDRISAISVCDNKGNVSMYVVCVYLPFFNGTLGQKQFFIDTLLKLQAFMDSHQDVAPVLICGDFNATLPKKHSALKENWYRRAPYNTNSLILHEFLETNELVTMDHLKRQKVKYTYFCHKTNTYTWIDHMMCTPNLKSRVASCVICEEEDLNVSDHLPLCSTLTLLSDRGPQRSTTKQHPVLNWDNKESRERYYRTVAGGFDELQSDFNHVANPTEAKLTADRMLQAAQKY